ncbi:MAG: hypothetical protein EZS28_005547 [Streblomastix strix]|uniref:Uncharacterized protein n=1 Tax=Streblomastix strix TaxID=222440 RepID=A0A5J4WV43_9EUKA|nr:MAG: hypothetical protein EZS28_005547 [Streblomastix strix]
MSSVYLDEALLDSAGLSDFPELYAYIHERYQDPVPPAYAIQFGEQTLQQQLKGNDDILNKTNEVFVPSVSNAPTKLDLSSQLERSNFLASSGSDPQLIVYDDRVTLTASYATTGLFTNGYLFNSYPEEARPKESDKVIALVETNSTNKKYQKFLPPNMKYMPIRTEQQEYTAMNLFKDIYDKSLAVEVTVSGKSNDESNEEPNASPQNPNALLSDPKESNSNIDEVIIKHDKLQASSSKPINIITNVFNQIQLIAPFDQGGRAYNMVYIVDDGTCRIYAFNLYFESKLISNNYIKDRQDSRCYIIN